MVWHRYLIDCTLSICQEQHFGRFKADVEGTVKRSRREGQPEVISICPVFKRLGSPRPGHSGSLLLLRPSCHGSFFPCGCPLTSNCPLFSTSLLQGERKNGALEPSRDMSKSRLPLLLTVWPRTGYLPSHTFTSDV